MRAWKKDVKPVMMMMMMMMMDSDLETVVHRLDGLEIGLFFLELLLNTAELSRSLIERRVDRRKSRLKLNRLLAHSLQL